MCIGERLSASVGAYVFSVREGLINRILLDGQKIFIYCVIFLTRETDIYDC